MGDLSSDLSRLNHVLYVHLMDGLGPTVTPQEVLSFTRSNTLHTDAAHTPKCKLCAATIVRENKKEKSLGVENIKDESKQKVHWEGERERKDRKRRRRKRAGEQRREGWPGRGALFKTE